MDFIPEWAEPGVLAWMNVSKATYGRYSSTGTDRFAMAWLIPQLRTFDPRLQTIGSAGDFIPSREARFAWRRSFSTTMLAGQR